MDKNTIFNSYENTMFAEVIINIDDIKCFVNEFEQNEFLKFCTDWQIELKKKKNYKIKELSFYTTTADIEKKNFLSFEIIGKGEEEYSILKDCLLVSKEAYDVFKKYKLPANFIFPTKIISDFNNTIWDDYYFIKFFGVDLYHVNFQKSAFYNENGEELFKIKNLEDYFISGHFFADKKIICLSVKPKFDIINLDNLENYFSEELFNELISKKIIDNSEKGNNLIYFEDNKEYSTKLEMTPVRYFDRNIDKDFNFEELDFREPDINLILNEGYESENQKILLGEKINKTRNLELQYKEENLECYAGINGNLEMYIDEELAYIKIFDEKTYNVRVQDFDYNVFDDKFPIFLKSKYKSQEIIEKDYNILYFSDMHLILVQPKVEYIAKIAIIFNKKCEEYIENKINNKEML